jgi:hypothetical protein
LNSVVRAALLLAEQARSKVLRRRLALSETEDLFQDSFARVQVLKDRFAKNYPFMAPEVLAEQKLNWLTPWDAGDFERRANGKMWALTPMGAAKLRKRLSFVGEPEIRDGSLGAITNADLTMRVFPGKSQWELWKVKFPMLYPGVTRRTLLHRWKFTMEGSLPAKILAFRPMAPDLVVDPTPSYEYSNGYEEQQFVLAKPVNGEYPPLDGKVVVTYPEGMALGLFRDFD